MRLNFFKYWHVYFFVVGATVMFAWLVYTEIHIHYFLEFNGPVIQKEKIPPKNMPDLVVRGSIKTFPTWKWNNIDFDSVQIGDSIVKRKYESKAFWFKRNSDGTYDQIELTYWTE